MNVGLYVSVDDYILSVEDNSVDLSVASPIVVQEVVVPVYDGAYELTPTAEMQTIPVHGYRFEQDLIIDPIPSNYGLITWNGSQLTVS